VPTTRGPQPPAETAAESKGGDTFFLISSLTLAFCNVRVMLLEVSQPAIFCCLVKSDIVLWKPFAKSISISNATVLKVML